MPHVVSRHALPIGPRAFAHRWSFPPNGTLRLWLERHRARRELAMLDDHMLADIGLSAGDAYAEAGKPFWRA